MPSRPYIPKPKKVEKDNQSLKKDVAKKRRTS